MAESPSAPEVDVQAKTIAAAPRPIVDEPTDEPHESWLAEIASAPDVPVGPQRGEVLGGSFVVERQLGKGGMGVVYLAHQGALDRKVAIKLHRAHSAKAAERLLREAKALARVHHEHIIVVYEVGRWNDDVFVAMEYVEGGNAREWVAAQDRDWREIVELYRKAGLGLQAAHERGLVHRDFKPDNLLVGSDGRVRVADFGLVRAAADSSSSETMSQTLELGATQLTDGLVGTPGYMAPEQFHNASVDPAADQFAFCVALFEALDGQRPYFGHDLRALVKSLHRGRPRELDPDRAPAFVRAALRRGLSVHPDDRFPDMAALVRELGRDPEAVWRRRVFIGAAVAATGLATWALVRAPDPILACRDDAPAGWTSAQADRVHRSLAATARPFAEDSFARIDEALRERSQAVVRLHDEACQAVHREGTRSRSELAAHDRCLAARQHELEGLAALFEQRAEEVIDNGVRAVASLPDVDACAIDRVGADPVHEEDRARVDALTNVIAKANGLVSAGLFAEALATAEAAEDEARALGYAQPQAELALALADAHNRLRHDADASAGYGRALRHAIASDDHGLAARAASYLVYIDGYRRQAPQKAIAWAELADALLERAGRPHRAQLLFLDNHALALRSAGDFEGALRESEAALSQMGEADDLLRAVTLGVLGETERQLGRTSAALAHQRDSVAAYARALGPSHPSLVNALNMLGVTELSIGDYAAAEQTFTRALAIAEPTMSAGSVQVVELHANLAIVLAQTGRSAEARAMFERAWRDARASERPADATLAGLAGLLAAFYLEQDDREAARAMQAEAIAMTRATAGDDSVELAGLLVQSAELEPDPHAALELVERGLATLRAQLEPNAAELADAISTRGQVLARLGRCDEALPELAQSRALLVAALGADAPPLARNWLAWARCALRRDDRETAVAAARDAARIARTAMGRPSPEAEAVLEEALARP